ncbi:TPA: TIGR00296 family protein [Candidatus Micrarchaeota archaeon]|nr:TIGR00296 family protein [Candidatus Micrarchaeota archaeon]
MAFLTGKEAEYVVRLARRSVEHFLERGELLRETPPCEKLKTRAGVFTTINTFPAGHLRGCIGYPEPVKPLYQAVVETAVLAATDDPRFPPVAPEELDRVVFEVSILTPPKKLEARPEERHRHVEVGRHGIIVRRGRLSGLLLPQVAGEYGWDAETFLDHACMKAGLPPGCWRSGDTDVFLFEAEVYGEVEPRGAVIRLL